LVVVIDVNYITRLPVVSGSQARFYSYTLCVAVLFLSKVSPEICAEAEDVALTRKYIYATSRAGDVAGKKPIRFAAGPWGPGNLIGFKLAGQNFFSATSLQRFVLRLILSNVLSPDLFSGSGRCVCK
jgi:hypothetical protein